MIIILKILTILVALVLLWIAFAIVLYVPLRVQQRYKKVIVFPGGLAIFILVISAFLSFRAYLDGPGREPGGILWPILVVGTSLGCFLVFGFYALMIKRFSLTNKFVIPGSFTIALLIMIVLHIFLPIHYTYDSKAMNAYNENNISDCANMEYGQKMFMSEDQRTYYSRECYREAAVATGNEDFCDEIIGSGISGQNANDCKNNVKIIEMISKELCPADYDTACVITRCSSLRSAYSCGYLMAKKDSKWCEIFGEQGKYMEPCR